MHILSPFLVIPHIYIYLSLFVGFFVVVWLWYMHIRRLYSRVMALFLVSVDRLIYRQYVILHEHRDSIHAYIDNIPYILQHKNTLLSTPKTDYQTHAMGLCEDYRFLNKIVGLPENDAFVDAVMTHHTGLRTLSTIRTSLLAFLYIWPLSFLLLCIGWLVYTLSV